ncbi:hypothetical protein H2198_000613 [Neophaeococcomyces mojaviensis]|uniref:Uncharacterized protein n=1 Tax=Neophaeococcomyces mojaviensis TaxID=3383035 RepID=A0ACC3AJB5_9EURO|nr:hypothetical protein H2198_000613 [Knufia sp. JES_112]
MTDSTSSLVTQAYLKFYSNELRPSLHPVPGTKPLTVVAAVLPPLLYYLALLFLPPAPPHAIDSFAVKALYKTIALLAGVLFLRLPLAYHVPQSIGLTYQLGLVGIYGGCRVLDAFFISPYLFGHIPRRVSYTHNPRPETPGEHHVYKDRTWTDGGLKDPFSGTANPSARPSRAPTPEPEQHGNSTKVEATSTGISFSSAPWATSTSIHAALNGSTFKDRKKSTTFQDSYFVISKALAGPNPQPVYEHAKTEDGLPHSWSDRASWALELELSMRGQGFTWTTADVRHTRRTWLPTLQNRIHSIIVHVLPVQLASWFIISTIYDRYLAATIESPSYNPFAIPASEVSISYHLHRPGEPFDSLPVHLQLLLTLALGSFLMSAFSLGHSAFAIMLHPLSPHPLAFFPPLYTTRVWGLTSVRKFWSYGWHRLFARLFLVYGVWPGEWVERKVLRKSPSQPADVGKLLGAFLSSAFVHAFSVRGVLAGRWQDAMGEARFFALNGVACVVEAVVQRAVKGMRRQLGLQEIMWYDKWIGRAWWISAVVWSGREFARGWVKSGLVREMSFR